MANLSSIQVRLWRHRDHLKISLRTPLWEPPGYIHRDNSEVVTITVIHVIVQTEIIFAATNTLFRHIPHPSLCGLIANSLWPTG